MEPSRIAWAVTGSGHYIEECIELMLTLDNVDLYLSQAGEEVLKMYAINIQDLRDKVRIYRDKSASAPPVGLFYKNYYQCLVLAPTTSNTVAKCVLGIADSLVTNLFSQAGKCRIPNIVYPCDIAPAMETTAPSGKVMVYPRKIDLEASHKLRDFEYTSVVESVADLSTALTQRLQQLS
jgi:flavoprotein